MSNWIIDVKSSVEVHFENKDGGFFIKHSPRQYYPTIGRAEAVPAQGSPSANVPTGAVLSVDEFTVFQTSEPVSIRATYGPFSTKQTVPARYIVPDPLDILPPTVNQKSQNNTAAPPTSSTGQSINSFLDAQELSSRHLDMSAHIVSPSVARDSPVLRVLFHAGSEVTGRRQISRHQRVCVMLHATFSGGGTSSGRMGAPRVTKPNPEMPAPNSVNQRGVLTASCSPDGEDGVCLAQVTIPANWWPSLPAPDSSGRIKIPKTLPRYVQLAYSVLEPRAVDETGAPRVLGSEDYCQPRVQIQPLTPIGQVTLAPNRATYKEIKADEYLTLLVPHGPLYPRSRLHVPVFLYAPSQRQSAQNKPSVTAVIIKIRVKSGVKILDAMASSSNWIVESEVNQRYTGGTFTARCKDPSRPMQPGSAEEILTMLLEASEESVESNWDGGRVVCSVRYILEGEEDNASMTNSHQPGQHHHHHHNMERRKLQARLEIQKDDIQAVLPISKNWEVMNTAVLTGRQVSQAMKVFIVSQSGNVGDVTLQSSCHSEDESVLKVSSSCSSVYVDGSEIRGSSNASVLVKYGTYTGLARFTVWMPEFPLEVSVGDTRLNQIKSWKVPDDPVYSAVTKNKRSLNDTTDQPAKRSTSDDDNVDTDNLDEDVNYEQENEHDEDDYEDYSIEEGATARLHTRDKWDSEINTIDTRGSNCRLRFQQTPVDVYARFFATDHDSGRVSYFVNRRTWLRVTDLVIPYLRVSDPRIAALIQGKIVQGKGIGRTEVQVLSPNTGRVIGAKEIRVGNDRVSISGLSVKIVSGLQLNISPDSSIENGYVAETSVTRKLTAQYQEGLLDIDIEFSDSTRTALREIAVSDYHLSVESLDSEVVAYAPMVASHHPRVIAVGEGRGDFLRITLQLADACRLSSRKSKGSTPRITAALPLATATANVEVDFASSELPNRPELVQNDGGGNLGMGSHHRERKNGRDVVPDLQDILIGGMGGVDIRHHNRPMMTPLEIGIYVLLAAFAFAIVVFLVSCVVYASKFKSQPSESALPSLPMIGAARAAASQFTANNRRPRESTTNAHDWVWLGRATLERAACVPHQVRVTSNPLSTDAADEIGELGTSFDNPNHIELPSEMNNTASAPIDTTTYCKKDKVRSFANKGQSVKMPLVSTSTNNDNDVPPPLPPHGVPSKVDATNGNDEDYKPPVPPHRGIVNRLSEAPKKRHRSVGSEHPIARRHRSKSSRSKNAKETAESRNDDKRSRNLKASKRATVVGNPMFSSNSSASSSTSNHEENVALDDLNLGMDYNQIMQLFDNLKESNA